MREDVARDLSDSAYDFLRVVWPAIQPRLRGGRMEPVETTVVKNMQRDLDVLAGIDAWQMLDEHGVMRGIASRLQWGPKSWDTFTVRLERQNGARTEYEKRMAAYMDPDAGWLIPTITVQAYLTEPKRRGKLLAAGIAYTRDLLEFSVRYPCGKPRRNPADGVLFNYYDWRDMRDVGYRVDVVHGADTELLTLIDGEGE